MNDLPHEGSSGRCLKKSRCELFDAHRQLARRVPVQVDAQPQIIADAGQRINGGRDRDEMPGRLILPGHIDPAPGAGGLSIISDGMQRSFDQ